MIKLGITGGIASGKTLSSKFLQKKERGAYIFNADKESKKHLKSSITLQKRKNLSLIFLVKKFFKKIK